MIPNLNVAINNEKLVSDANGVVFVIVNQTLEPIEVTIVDFKGVYAMKVFNITVLEN